VDALWTEAEQVERSSVVDARGVFAHSGSEFLARLKPTKGELVEFTLPNGPASVMIKRDLFLQPLGGDRYRAGATFEWHDFSPGSTEQGKAKLQAGLVQLLGEDLSGAYDFEYKAGLRPASHDRRPYVGAHPGGGNRWVFNGFGAKGVLLAPLLASELTAAMEGKGVLNPEADTKRLGPFLSGELET
jgi:glycine/D-amino acid oxidase-like deaminating enzyme